MSGLEGIIDQLASTTVEDVREVSFAGKGLKLDTEEDAEVVVQAIKDCPGMNVLCLEGNTVGVPAAKAIAKALESQHDFKKALWKDMFTRRTEHEIPDALNFLSSGIILGNARLVELDLSDNAFGPRGLKGIVNLLKSPPCYTLRELRLNNNGLGISGAKMLGSALCQCLINSRKQNKLLCLKVFICGRNRLENEGSLALSYFLKDAGTLEHIAMPQNGIYHEGIAGLAEAFAANTGLKILNLEDNSLTEKGAISIAEKLNLLKNLETINLGDCLIRTDGAKAIAQALENNCPNLRELLLGFNEMKKEGGIAVVEAMKYKFHLERLTLNGNQFGEDACNLIKEVITKLNKRDMLTSLSEDEGSDDDGEEEEEEEYDEENDKENEEPMKNGSTQFTTTHKNVPETPVTFESFMLNPTVEQLLHLYQNQTDVLSFLPQNPSRNDYLSLFMKIACVVKPGDEEAKKAACHYSDDLLSVVFKNCPEHEMWLFNNDFLVTMHLIKEEGVKICKTEDVTGACIVLQHVSQQPYFIASTKELLKVFFSKPLKYAHAPTIVVNKLMQILYM